MREPVPEILRLCLRMTAGAVRVLVHEILRLRLRMTVGGGAGTGARDPSAVPQDDSKGRCGYWCTRSFGCASG